MRMAPTPGTLAATPAAALAAAAAAARSGERSDRLPPPLLSLRFGELMCMADVPGRDAAPA
jgi:hypothetical protein